MRGGIWWAMRQDRCDVSRGENARHETEEICLKYINLFAGQQSR